MKPISSQTKKSETELLELFSKAFKFHQQGNLNQARAIYEMILAKHPKHFDALHLSGVMALQTNDHAKAVEFIEKALQVFQNHSAAYSNYGLALHRLKRFDQAISSYKKAIQINPSYADAHYNCGNSLFEKKYFIDAVTSYDHAIKLQPDFAIAHNNRGLALHNLNRLTEALASFKKAIHYKPSYAEAHFNCGNSLYQLKHFSDAVTSYDRAIEIQPQYAEACINRGNALQKLKNHDLALASYNQGIEIRPDCPEAYINRGFTLHCLQLFDAALTSYDRAIEIKPDSAEAYNNRGFTLQELRRTEEAVACYQHAIAFQSNYAMAHSNRGIALQELGYFDEAIKSLDRAIALDAELSNAHWNKSLILLRMGQFEIGWKLYQWRFKEESTGVNSPNFSQPLWLGSPDIAGKTILLHAEQGLGDTIQFCRYAQMLKSRGATVVLKVPQELAQLLNQLEGADQLVFKRSALPSFHCHCPLLSLPLAFKTELHNIPDPTPYIFAPPAKRHQWSIRLGHKTKRRIGLVWSGSTDHRNDHNRSLSLTKLITNLPSAFEYISLQKEIRQTDKQALQSSNIRHFGDELIDFTDTAALCDLMDLVISVDTSVAHLAGAMGKPTWIMLPYVPDWRWMLNRDDSPWYSSVKLYRQDEQRNWAPVIGKIANDLGNFKCHG